MLQREDLDARECFVLLTRDRKGALVLLLGVAECADADVDPTRSERGSQFFGSLMPSSRSSRARAAIPTRNASGKLCRESGGTPSASRPA
jgi:hypothetical protein